MSPRSRATFLMYAQISLAGAYVVVGLERKLVLTRQDVDEEPGKGVVAPGAPDLAGLFIDGEIHPGALQRLGHEQPRHAGAGNDHPKIPISHHASQDPRRHRNFKPLARSGTTPLPVEARVAPPFVEAQKCR